MRDSGKRLLRGGGQGKKNYQVTTPSKEGERGGLRKPEKAPRSAWEKEDLGKP